MTSTTIATTEAGRVRGVAKEGVATYLGIPYAAAPVGELRFAAPQPVPPWAGVREAVDPGPTAPQRGANRCAGIDMFPITGAEWRRGDDFLTLNVWAPMEGTGHPVMVYVHGGGLTLGTKDAAVYDGRNFARDGAVAVNINYRLGVEGFLAIPDAPTNLGLRDMLAALHWVQANIEAFGGDPSNVTVFGESGGGIAVACLLSSPLSTGLFARAIVQSGHGSAVYPVAIAHRLTRKIAELLDVPATVAGFRSAPPEAALAALGRASRPGTVDLRDDTGFVPGFGLTVINPVFGDDVLPLHPLDALEDGAGQEVDLLIGTTEDEFNFTTAPLRAVLAPTWLARLILRRLTPEADELMHAYREQDRRARGGVVMSRILGDLAFRGPAREYAGAHRGRTFFYEFDWDSPASGGRLGAAHGTDIAFVFDTLPSVTGKRGILGTNPPQRLATRIHGTWLEFAADGRIPWGEYDAHHRRVHRLAADTTIDEAPILASTMSSTRATARP
ncbi:carboxylesterase/lipase family protein [Agromyces silvae]|uniref:carboxylesterase/lipase family protein n=1 Tax=Agromyces silvae TaxID=3388266 RepID=UPI00280C0D30|nr:carboxylesterase family protein [Agromyces protaetiae]